MISRTTVASVGIAAGVLGSVFIGYCIYFDRKRRSDPSFHRKLKDKRKTQKQSRSTVGSALNTQIPDLNDPAAVQKFFLEEVQIGEELLAQGSFEEGVEHLSNAVAVCAQPQQLLQLLHQTLPKQVFQLLVKKLPATSQRISSMSSASGVNPPPGFGGPGATIVEEDLE